MTNKRPAGPSMTKNNIARRNKRYRETAERVARQQAMRRAALLVQATAPIPVPPPIPNLPLPPPTLSQQIGLPLPLQAHHIFPSNHVVPPTQSAQIGLTLPPHTQHPTIPLSQTPVGQQAWLSGHELRGGRHGPLLPPQSIAPTLIPLPPTLPNQNLPTAHSARPLPTIDPTNFDSPPHLLPTAGPDHNAFANTCRISASPEVQPLPLPPRPSFHSPRNAPASSPIPATTPPRHEDDATPLPDEVCAAEVLSQLADPTDTPASPSSSRRTSWAELEEALRIRDYANLPDAPNGGPNLCLGAMGWCAGLSSDEATSEKRKVRDNAYVAALADARKFVELDPEGSTAAKLLAAFTRSNEEGMAAVEAKFLPYLKGMHSHMARPVARIIALIKSELEKRFHDPAFRSGLNNKNCVGVFMVEKPLDDGVQGIVLNIYKGEVFLVEKPCARRKDLKYLIRKPIALRIFGKKLYATNIEQDSFRMQTAEGLDELTWKCCYAKHYTCFFVQEVLDRSIGAHFPTGGLGQLFIRSFCFIWMFAGTVAQMLHRDDLHGAKVSTYGDNIYFNYGSSSYFLMWQSAFAGPGWTVHPSKLFWLLHVLRRFDKYLVAEAYRQTGFNSCEENRDMKVHDLCKEIIDARALAIKKNERVPACKVKFAILYDMLKERFVVEKDHIVIGSSSTPHAGMGLTENDMADDCVVCPCGVTRTEETCPHVGYGDNQIPPLQIRRSYTQCLTRVHFMFTTEEQGEVRFLAGTKIDKKFTYPVELFCYDEKSNLVGNQVPVHHGLRTKRVKPRGDAPSATTAGPTTAGASTTIRKSSRRKRN